MSVLLYGIEFTGQIDDELKKQLDAAKYDVYYKDAVAYESCKCGCDTVYSSTIAYIYCARYEADDEPLSMPTKYTINHFDNWLAGRNIEARSGFYMIDK